MEGAEKSRLNSLTGMAAPLSPGVRAVQRKKSKASPDPATPGADGSSITSESIGKIIAKPSRKGSSSAALATPTLPFSRDEERMAAQRRPPSESTSPSPIGRYRGWQSEVVAQLDQFIDDQVDPRDHYQDLIEIGEGMSGSVYCARLAHKDIVRLRLPTPVKAKDAHDVANGREILVAIKSVAILPTGSQKLNDLQHELTVLRELSHKNILSLDALYVDLMEDTLWIRMELMERSLPDVIALVDDGLVLQERTMARFASDVRDSPI